MIKRISTLIILTFVSIAHGEVKPYMDLMLKEIFTLKPFIISDVDYRDPKNSQKIEDSLKQMVELSEKISHEDKISKSGFSISSKALKEQLKEAELVFRVGNKDYSLWMLRSTLSVCMSCHTQLPAVSTKFETANKENFLQKPFDEAEFLFIIRNFDKAIPIYDDVINKFVSTKDSLENADKALARKVYYFVRVKRDFSGLAANLKTHQKNKNLPPSFLKKINEYIRVAEKMKKEGFPDFSASQQTELKKYVELELREELQGNFASSVKKDLAYLKVSSVLYKYLDQFPDAKIKPEILYWLSFCERRYEQKAFYSLPELYLKQCITEFPGATVAKSCLKEYQELVSLAYTGSSGTHVPKDVERELKSLKEMVEKLDGKNNRKE